MSDISITGNEAQFNENVTFLKDVNIGGIIKFPNQNLNLNNLSVTGQILGSPDLIISAGFLTVTADKIKISGLTTFTNAVDFKENVSFNQALSFTDLEIRDRFRVGSGGTVITADSFLNRVGIGSSAPTELLDVLGKGKIVDLELENLLVTGLSTFQNDVLMQGTGGGTIFFDKSENALEFSANSKAGFGSVGYPADLNIFSDGNNKAIISTGNSFASINIKTQKLDGTTSGQEISLIADLEGGFTDTLANFIPNSKVELFFDGAPKFETTGIGVSVLGDLIVPDTFPDTGIRTSRVGLGTLNPSGITTQLNDDVNGPLRLAVDGSVGISRNIYDSAGSPGSSGAFLNRDERGIRWVTFEPQLSEGIFIQDEGVYIPNAGAAKSYSILNFKKINSFGLGVDNVTAEDAGIAGIAGTSVGLANILTFDLWGYTGLSSDASIYRMTKVGIGSTTPGPNLDVIGDAQVSGGTTTGTLKVVGLSTFEDDIDARTNVNIGGTLGVVRSTSIGRNLEVIGLSTFNDNVDINGNLDVSGDTTLGEGGNSLTVNADSVFNGDIDANGDLDVSNNTVLGDSSGDSLTVNATSTFLADVSINANLNVDGHTELDDLRVSGVSSFVGFSTFSNSVFIAKNLNTDTLNVVGISTFGDNIDANRDVDIAGQLNVVGLSTFGNDVDINANLDVSGNTILGDGSGDSLTVNATSTFQENVTVNANVSIGGTLGVAKEVGFSSSFEVAGVSTFKDDIFIGVGATVGFGSTAYFRDNASLYFGDGNDLEIKHNGNSSSIKDLGNGRLFIDSNGDGINLRKSNGDSLAIFNTDSSAEIYYSADKKFETTNAGILVSGGTTTRDFKATGVSTFANTVDLDGPLKDINDSIGFSNEVGVCKTDYRLASVGTGVSWRPSGVQTKRTIWVSKNGCDTNSGLLEGDAKATVGAAASIALETDTIKIRPGIYEEDNPIGLRTDVSVTGEDIRLVIIKPKNTFKDVFHVRRGCLVENLNFGGSNVGVPHDGAACVAFPPFAGPDSAITGYTEPGPATEGPTDRWRSPYVRNCTNFMTGSIGMKIDGDHATARTIGADLKSMVCDSFTQYNEAGIGVSLTNNAYAQLVSIFTINSDIGIFASSGAQCDLTNSNSSFGNFGLVAVGLGTTQFTGTISNVDETGTIIGSTNAEGQDTVVAIGLTDSANRIRRPFDGQALFFQINLDNYPDVQGTGRITAPLQQLSSVKLNDGVDLSGFSALDPPDVLIRDADGIVEPKGPQGIIAEATATVDPNGFLTEINVVAQGRNYLPTQNIVIDIEGDTTLATAVMQPIFFTVESATNPTPVTGITSITFNEFIPYELFPDDPFSLRRISRILTSSHSFEYVGTGTDINIATPLQGAIPIKANEIVPSDGAQIPFTSTDQKGNFDIGEGLQIDQTTSTIRGRDFSRAIQAEVTPLILALR